MMGRPREQPARQNCLSVQQYTILPLHGRRWFRGPWRIPGHLPPSKYLDAAVISMYHAANMRSTPLFSLLQEGLKHDGEAEKRRRHSLPSGDSVPRGVQHGETLRHAEAREVLHGDVDLIIWHACWGQTDGREKGQKKRRGYVGTTVCTSSGPRRPTAVKACQKRRVT